MSLPIRNRAQRPSATSNQAESTASTAPPEDAISSASRSRRASRVGARTPVGWCAPSRQVRALRPAMGDSCPGFCNCLRSLMRLVVWNMGNGGPGASAENHERGWQYLEELAWDVALLQETRSPPNWAATRYASLAWRPKYSRSPTGRPLWGCAVVGRSVSLEAYEPTEAFPWLSTLEGSTAIARSGTDPRWFVSVHLKAARIPDDVVAAHSIEGVELTTRDSQPTVCPACRAPAAPTQLR